MLSDRSQFSGRAGGYARISDDPQPVVASTSPSARGARRRVYLHQSVLDWMAAPSSDRQLTQRARLVLWQMFAQGAPTQVKSVRGAGRGWLRSDLGGNNGHQFYLWWTRGGAPPLKGRGISPQDVLVRAVRHHDETNLALDPGDERAWLPLEGHELDGYDLSPPMLDTQRAVLAARARVRLVRGHPGTGKSTVLGRAALGSAHGAVLYLTYTERLAERARRYLDELAASPGRVRVMTFRALFESLKRAWGVAARAMPDDDGREALASAMTSYQDRYAPWEGRLDALHAELHAHFAGASLPYGFRDAPACARPGFAHDDYVALRKDAIGERAASRAARIAATLIERDALREVAPGPCDAHALLTRCREGASVPDELGGYGAVVVDEVQDLTRVESALLVDLVAAIGRAHAAPVELLVAGDEGQTVRPTDFEWGCFADLVAREFGEVESFDLERNVRSPRALAAVLDRTTSLYRELAKDQRPRGRATEAHEETVSGRVLRCELRDEADIARLAEALGALPGVALVHPGDEPPTWCRGIDLGTFSSAAAKGLDFSVVAVLGAGRHLAELRALAAQGEVDPLHRTLARSRIDQLRVAVSRASDTLVFIDQANDHAAAEVDRLLQPDGAAPEGFLGVMSVDDVTALLERSDASSEELVREFLADVRQTTEAHPRHALACARRAYGLLGRSDSRVGVADLGLRAEVMRARGVAATRVAMLADTSATEHRTLLTEANTVLNAAHEPTLARAVICLRDLAKTGRDVEAAEELAGLLEPLVAQVPSWDREIRKALDAWAARHADAALPTGTRAKRQGLDALVHVAASLPGSEAMASRVERLRARTAEALHEAGAHAEALAIAREMTPRPDSLEARCLEALGHHAEAAEVYQRAGVYPDALRCLRAVGDINEALALAARIHAPELPVLQRLRGALDAMADCAQDLDALTRSEREALREVVARVVPTRGRR